MCCQLKTSNATESNLYQPVKHSTESTETVWYCTTRPSKISISLWSSVIFDKFAQEFIHLVVCLTTGPKPLPNRALHIVRSRASSFNCEYPLLSLRSSSSFLRFLPRLPVTSIPPFIFPSITRCRRQFQLYKLNRTGDKKHPCLAQELHHKYLRQKCFNCGHTVEENLATRFIAIFWIMIAFYTNLMKKFFILIHLLHSSACFEHYCAHLHEDKCISTASGIVTLFRWLFSTEVTRVLS